MRRLAMGLIGGISIVMVGCATTPQEPQIQRISAEELEQLIPPPVATLSLEEIVSLSKSGVSADDIIAKIKETGSQYDLTPSQAVELAKQGVDAKVLDHIYSSREQALRDSMAEEINKRELENRKEQERIKREYQLRYTPYYHPWYGYTPWWRFRYYGPGYYW